MRDLFWCWAPLFALSIALTGCSDDPECTTDGGCDEADSAMPDAGMDSVSGDSGSSDSNVPDARIPDGGMPDIGLPDVDTTPTGPDDYALCDSTLDCPAGLGRCLLNLPLHHPDTAMNALIAVSDVFAGVPEGRGICAESCEASPGACGSSAFLANAPDYTCQVVYAAATPYVLGGVADEAMRAGDSFAALCRPSFDDAASRLPETCDECTSDAECGAGRCWDLGGDAPFDGDGDAGVGRCIEDCSAEAPCAQGFSCETTSTGDDSVDLCLPLLATCESCVDADEDGYGLGFCDPTTQGVTLVDCDDAEPTTFYEAEPVCGSADHNCNGFADDVDMVGTDAYGPQHCSACGDGCSDEALGDLVGSIWECTGAEGARTCDAACEAGRFDCNMDGACEVDATSAGFQWALDADDDGAPCNPEPGSPTCVVVTACAAPLDMVPAREYSADPFSCSGVSCPDADDDNEFIFPGGEEFCDILDNNQTGAADENFPAGTAVCQLSNRAESCGGFPLTVNIGSSCVTTCSSGGAPLAGSWQCTESGVACAATAAASDVACNGLDDNCDGRVDEPVGDACVISGLDSPCKREATQQCSGGALTCTASAAAAYASVHDAPGDNYDADCDGEDGEADAIYVYSASVVPGEDGTRARPFRGLRDALNQANAPGGSDTIYVQSAPGVPVLLEGGPLDLRAGLRIYGGFSGGATAWNYTTSASDVCVPPSATPVTHVETVYVPGFYYNVGGMAALYPPYTTNSTKRAYVGLRCEGLTGTATPAVVSRIDLEVTGCGPGSAATPTGVGHSVYGGIFIDCENVILRDLTVTNGAAGAGRGSLTQSQPTSLGIYDGGRGGTQSNPTPGVGEGPDGGARGITIGGDGEWPTAGGDRGNPAAAPLPFPALPTAPSDGAESFYLSRHGYLEHFFISPYRSRNGGSGDHGSGGGGGFVGVSAGGFFSGGTGGTGGRRGSGGLGAYAGGDNVALVLLGTQLPTLQCSASASPPIPNTPDFTPCGLNVSFDGGPSGAGGAGGVGGQGGDGGGGGDGAPNGSDVGGDGGGGGPGCGGGGGGGGTAGAAAGLLHDISSSDAADDAVWLNFSAGSAGPRGNAAAQGPDGVAGDGNSRDAPPGRAACSGNQMSAQGRSAMRSTRSNLPMLSCGDLSTVDTQDIDADQWVLQPVQDNVSIIPTVDAVMCPAQ